MSKSGPIVIVEDDRDDRDLLEKIFQELNIENTRTWFDNADQAMEYLLSTTSSTFAILCDINLHGTSGLSFKEAVDADPYLRKKSIPFIFHSTTVSQQVINDAYSKVSIQGFFKKDGSYKNTKAVISTILDYWKLCKHPNM